MEARDVLKLIKRGEGESVEFKVEKVDSKELAQAMAAFSTLKGGVILIGVSDDGKVAGVKSVGKLREKVLNVGLDTCDPRIFPGVVVVKIEGKNVVAVKVPEGFIKPCYAYRVPYTRVENRCIPLRHEEAERLRHETRLLTFEKLPVKNAGVKDLDKNKVVWYAQKRSEIRRKDMGSLRIEDILINLGAVTRQDRKLVPTVAGLLFFGARPRDFLGNAIADCARFKGTNMIEFMDRTVLEGSIPELIDQVELFVRKNTRTAAKIVDFERINVPEYPHAAIREAIANAIAHRDYFFSGAVVRVMIFDDRIEVESPGKLPRGVDLKHLEGRHVPRNETIAQLLYDVGYIEKFGTGIRRMREEMKSHGLREPVFAEEGEFFKVTFYGPGERILDLAKPQRGTDLKEIGLNERQIQALKLMINERRKMTIRDYVNMFQVNKRTAIRDMQKLVKLAFVEKHGERRGAYFVGK
jgi:ATP-dependent DNA helicase RecG